MSLPSPSFDLLTIAGVSLHKPGWQALDTYRVFDPLPKRRQNRSLPTEGRPLGRRSILEPRALDLEVWVTGTHDANDDPHDDPIEGVELNIAYLTENVLYADEDDDGCVLGEAVRATGNWQNSGVQVDDLIAAPGIGARLVTIALTIVDNWEAVGS